jgi:glycosyltransferase involved in cell wall biosynthesis
MIQTIPQIHLIIPIYNAEKYLAACLDSLVAQSYPHFRALLIDDGSTDHSVDICRDYCHHDARFTLIQQSNQGVSAARNVGIDAVQEGYVGFVDADDCLYPQALEKMVQTLRATAAQVCIVAFELGQNFAPKTASDAPDTGAWIKDYEDTIEAALYQQYSLNAPWGMLMERSLLGDDIRFRTGIRYEDLDAFYRFYERAEKIAYLPQKLYFYRQIQESFMHRWSPQRLDVLNVTERIVMFMSERHPRLVPAALDRQFSANFNMLLLMFHYGVDDPEKIAQTWKVIRSLRLRELQDPKVRRKNKLGALISWFGLPLLRLIARRAKGIQ